MNTLARWWDAAELWVVGLPFAAQITVMMLVALPLCGAAAVALDRIGGLVASKIGTRADKLDDAAGPE